MLRIALFSLKWNRCYSSEQACLLLVNKKNSGRCCCKGAFSAWKMSQRPAAEFGRTQLKFPVYACAHLTYVFFAVSIQHICRCRLLWLISSGKCAGNYYFIMRMMYIGGLSVWAASSGLHTLLKCSRLWLNWLLFFLSYAYLCAILRVTFLTLMPRVIDKMYLGNA